MDPEILLACFLMGKIYQCSNSQLQPETEDGGSRHAVDIYMRTAAETVFPWCSFNSMKE